MREIKFRGLKTDNSGFEYGHYFFDNYELQAFIINADGEKIDVFSDSIQQFTGLHDKNGKEIFEGDILNYGNYRGSSNLNGKACNHIVKWDVDNACFSTKAIYESDTLFPLDSFAEIIGNIHEHNVLLDKN